MFSLVGCLSLTNYAESFKLLELSSVETLLRSLLAGRI